MLRKRIKKKKPLKLFTKQKLHSKSTYFYTKWFLNRKTQASDPANGFRVSLSSLRENSRFPEVPSAIQTRLSQKVKNPYGGITRLGSTYFLPVVCSLALLLMMGLAINPVISNEEDKAYAAMNEDLGNGSTISLSILNNATEVAENGIVSTDVTAGQMSYISNLIRINTNRIGKYYIGVQAASDGTSELVGRDHGATIAGVGSNVGIRDFGDNTWGYVLTDQSTADSASLAYSTLPAYNASASPQYQSMQNPSDGEHALKLAFAAKIRADKPADHYQTTALVSVAAEAKAITLAEITYMQDVNSDVCYYSNSADAAGNYQYQLIDKRDGKTYWVAKLKDGNCWMTQNLALDLNINIKLTDILSNVSANGYTPPANTQQGIIADFPSEDNLTFSYNPGEYVYTTPMEQNNCSTIGVAAMDGCPNWELIIGLSKDISGIEQAHYLAGNYYSYEIATASSEVNTVENNVASAGFDICPKGWRLPRGGYNEGELYNTFHRLTASVTDTTDNIKLTPYYFVYSGYVGTSSLSSAGNAGYYWSSTTSRSGSYSLLFFSSDVNMSLPMGAYYGLPVRCVAR